MPRPIHITACTDRSVAMKTALSECFNGFSCIKPNLQLGSREKVIFSLDNNQKRKSVLKLEQI